MNIQLGLKTKAAPKVRENEVYPFNGEAVITLRKAETRTRGIEFSAGAINMMEIWFRTLQGDSGHVNTTISCAQDVENNSVFIFVNTNGLEVEQFDINKTTMGFRNKQFYDLLVTRFGLDTTVDNHLRIAPFSQDVIDANLYRIEEIYVMQEEPATV